MTAIDLIAGVALVLLLSVLFERPHALWHRRYRAECKRCRDELLPPRYSNHA